MSKPETTVCPRCGGNGDRPDGTCWLCEPYITTRKQRSRIRVTERLRPDAGIWLRSIARATLYSVVITPVFIGSIWCVSKIATLPEFLALWGLGVAYGGLFVRGLENQHGR